MGFVCIYTLFTWEVNVEKQDILFLVDDDPIVLETLELELDAEFGSIFQFESAMDALEALEHITTIEEECHRVFMIISDWLMPGMKGDEFLIEASRRWPEIKCMLLTGQANEDSVKNAKDNSNMSFCMRKPWRRDELIKTIKNTLSSTQ